MTDAILVLNAGSSSLKFAVYRDEADPQSPVLRGKIRGIGTAAIFTARDADGDPVPARAAMTPRPSASHGDLIPALLDWLESHLAGFTVTAAGHRVVHGGASHTGPARVSDAVLRDLDALIPLAPLHQPHNLAAVRCISASAPDLAQVVCFDTSFHRTQGRLAQMFALPRALSDLGIVRYGFHGLSYDYIAGVLPTFLGARAEGRVVVAHLGNGASLCAMKARQSVATTMGFTALDGLVMGQRCGALDPGVLLYLLEQKGMTPDRISQLLYHESGLLGVSGISNDMATLEKSAAPEAREAIDLFCYRAAGEIARLAAATGGLDAIVFTAGIGENSALVRDLICDQLGWMGVALNPDANARNATRIASDTSAVDVLVLPTDEERVIARATHRLIHGAPAHPG
ncbi:acetate/propionate family kinase [Oceaniglobus indicus]|uniref:acetate/propionate family kinase n=1 Tax=Oceaniglobus indicus TaxID=2047749 RepID=UPI000C19E165|nr:acetate/propionate family kinase [Oceaniglobus indicus]